MSSEAGRLDLLRLIQLVPSTALSSALLLTSGVFLELAGAVGEVVTTILSTGCRVELLVFDTLVDLFFVPGKLTSAFLHCLPLIPLALLMRILRRSTVVIGIVIVFVVTATCNDIAAWLFC